MKKLPVTKTPHTHTYRDGDRMVSFTVEIESAVVPFDDILEAVEIKWDDEYDPLDGDTYAHDLVEVPYDVDVDADVPMKTMQAAVYAERKWQWIRLKEDPILDGPEDYGIPGMSKQVRYEFAAGAKTRFLEFIKKVYANEAQGYGVTCTFRGFHASVWGVDDEEYADTEVRQEIAEEVASEMVEAGYTVVGYPPVETLDQKRRRIRDKVRRNLDPASV